MNQFPCGICEVTALEGTIISIPGCDEVLLVSTDPIFHAMHPRDALWLVDHGYRMPPMRMDNICLASEPEHEQEQTLWTARYVIAGRGSLDCGNLSEPVETADGVFHLVQDREALDEIQTSELPPDAYYDGLRLALQEKFSKADPDLIEHIVPLVAAFDVATVHGLSFGIKKFHFAQHKVKLVGEIVGRDGRSPNPQITSAIRNWPPINTLKELQGFLGTTNYVKPHAGPAYNRFCAPLNVALKPGYKFPLHGAQLDAVEELKKLVLDDHVLAVPDEASAIEAANAFQNNAPPAGRPYELMADASGIAIGAVWGQRDESGIMRILGYCSAHLVPVSAAMVTFRARIVRRS